MMDTKTMKEQYSTYADKITEKRYHSPYAMRRYAHRSQYAAIIAHINQGENVLDAGCGEGTLSCLLAKEKGVHVTGIDISEPNIAAARALAIRMGVEHLVTFQVSDAEHLPFPDNSFDIVVSSHVLEHLPDFMQGLREIHRVTRDRAIVAVPTIFNLCSLIQAARGSFWEISKRSILALPLGFFKMLRYIGDEGVDEGYEGHRELTHIWRYPWVVRRRMKDGRFSIVSFEASAFPFPYINILAPLSSKLDNLRRWPILRYLGYGSTMVLKK